MIDKLKSYTYWTLAIVLAGLLSLQTWRLHVSQLAAAEAVVALAKDRATAAVGLAVGQEKNRTIEYTLHTDAAGITKATNVAVQNISTQRDALLQRVRVAESNLATAKLVSQVTSATDPGGTVRGGDGAELLGSVGAEDVVEAHRADLIRTHLQACYAKYTKARLALSQ